MQLVWQWLASGGWLGSSAGEKGDTFPPLFSVGSRAVVEGTRSGELWSTQPVGKALTLHEDQGELSTEEVTEAVGGTAKERPQPPLSTCREDVSFVVLVSRAGTGILQE